MEAGAERIDEEARRRFETHRYGGGADSISAFLPPPGDPRRRATLEELILIELEFRWKAWLAGAPAERGDGPSVDDLLATYTGRGELDVEAVARIRDEERPLQARFAARVAVQPGARIGRYTLVERAGRGATAEVWRARDDELRRDVAVKIARAELAGDDLVLARLLREAQSAAQLRHPSIVTVHEVAQHAGQPFIVSDFIAGPTLGAALAGGPLAPDRAARLAAQLADALAYAHGYGIVHRDVKPGNVLLAEGDRPVLTDFALAHLTRAESHLTRQGDVLGTPAYMAPEQARGDRDGVDQRTDVYGLGAVLFEMLAGRPPFVGDAAASVLYAVVHSRPPALAALGVDVPADLETICRRALARDRADRYPDARALADDLRRFLAGEPVLARPPGPWRRLRMWARRNPAVAGTLLVSGAAIALVTAVAFRSVVEERDLARESHFRALIGEIDARLAAQETGWYGRTMQALREAAALPVAGRDDLALRNLVLRAHGSLRPSFELASTWRPPLADGETVTALALAPPSEGRPPRFAGAGSTGSVWIAGPSGEDPRSTRLRGATALDLAWTADGAALLVAGGDDGALLLHGATLELLSRTPVDGGATCCAVADDGRLAAVAGASGSILLVDVGSPDGGPLELRRLAGHTGGVLTLAFAPGGAELVSTGEDSALRTWDVATGREVRSARTTDPARSLAVAPGGERIAYAAPENFGFGVGLRAGPFEDRGGLHRAGVRDLVFLGNARVVTASSDGTLRSFDLTHDEEAVADVEAGRVTAVTAWGATGVLAAYGDGRLRHWDLVEPPGRLRFGTSHRVAYVPGHDGFFTGPQVMTVRDGRATSRFQFGDGVRSLAVTRTDPPVHALLASGATVAGTARELAEVPLVSGVAPDALGLSPAGAVRVTWTRGAGLRIEGPGAVVRTAPLAVPGEDRPTLLARDDGAFAVLVGESVLWADPTDGAPRRLDVSGVLSIALAGPDLLVGTRGGAVVRRDAATGTLREIRRIQQPVAALAAVGTLSAGDGRLVAGDTSGRVHAWDGAGTLLFRTPERAHPVRRIALGPDAAWLVVTSSDHSRILDGTRGAVAAELFALALAATVVTEDGDLLGGTHLGGVWRWDRADIEARLARDRSERAAGRSAVPERLAPSALVLSGGHLTQVWGLAASPDGALLATSSHAGWIKLWSTEAPRRPLRDLHRAGEIAWCVAFSPDGRTLAAGSGRAVIRYDVATGAELSAREAHVELVSGLAYAPDGELLASVDMDGALYLWPDAGAGDAVRLHDEDGRLHDVTFSPDGRLLVAASSTGDILVWDVAGPGGTTPRPPDRRIGGHVSPAWAVAFDRRGRYLATGSQNGRVVLRDARTLDEIATLVADVERVRSLAFDADGAHLAVGCYHDLSLCYDLVALRGVLGELGLDWRDPVR